MDIVKVIVLSLILLSIAVIFLVLAYRSKQRTVELLHRAKREYGLTSDLEIKSWRSQRTKETGDSPPRSPLGGFDAGNYGGSFSSDGGDSGGGGCD